MFRKIREEFIHFAFFGRFLPPSSLLILSLFIFLEEAGGGRLLDIDMDAGVVALEEWAEGVCSIATTPNEAAGEFADVAGITVGIDGGGGGANASEIEALIDLLKSASLRAESKVTALTVSLLFFAMSTSSFLVFSMAG